MGRTIARAGRVLQGGGTRGKAGLRQQTPTARQAWLNMVHAAQRRGEEADASLSVGRVVPIYRALPGLPPRLRRRLVARALDEAAPGLPERLPPGAFGEPAFPSLEESLREAHFPGSSGGSSDPRVWEERTSPHLARLAFEELLELQVALARRRAERSSRPAPAIEADATLRRRLASILPRLSSIIPSSRSADGCAGFEALACAAAALASSYWPIRQRMKARVRRVMSRLSFRRALFRTARSAHCKAFSWSPWFERCSA